MEATACTRGRPRDPKIDDRILETALDQLAADGYAGMTIDGVARAAGVSKATIYRRWTDKNDLVTAAITCSKAPDAEDLTGNTRERLVALLQATRERMIDGPGMIVQRQVLAEAGRNPELVELHRERTIGPRIAILHKVLQEGVEAGEVRPDLDLDLTCDLLVGSWMARWARGEKFAPDWSRQVVATIWPALSA
ncbi:MAG: TetR/AcrR family transcriptional regulator [Solirubrobacterales bacterium]